MSRNSAAVVATAETLNGAYEERPATAIGADHKGLFMPHQDSTDGCVAQMHERLLALQRPLDALTIAAASKTEPPAPPKSSEELLDQLEVS